MILQDRISTVAYHLGNRQDLTAPISGTPTAGVVTDAEIQTPGVNYKMGDLVGLLGGTGAQLLITSVSDLTGGIVSGIVVLGGSGYSDGNSGVLAGSGTGAVFTITTATVQPPCRILYWLERAYINLMYENQFTDTEWTFTFNLTQGQDIYPYPSWVRAVEALTLYREDGTVITVETKDIKFIRRMANFINQSAPSMWCEFGKSIIFRPLPDNNGPYICDLDVWGKPVLADPLGATQILLPDDWVEALDWAATVRGHTALQEEDKAHTVQSLLYGFTDPTGKYTPGMIENLQTRIQASRPFKDWGVQPKGATQPFTRRR